MDKMPIEKLISRFIKRGGHIHKFYLQNSIRNKPSLVHLNGWYSGQNIREAIMKALSSK